ncbi:hydrolase, alpha/beta domain protein, partial [Anaerococcus hydrogenalis]
RTVRIAASKENNKQYLYYVHGGGFLMEMYFLYWLFADRITSSLGAELAVPIYPLLPEANMEAGFQAVLASYQRWYKTIPKDAKIHIIADSSGCSLALRLAQETVASGVPAPENLILISPWVDMNISDKRLHIYEQDDPFISVEALRECAAMAVPDQEYDDPRYSPLYGNLSGIGRLSVFTGTADTLYPNALALRNQATLAHVPINYYEHNGMFHIYPHFLVEEGRQAFAMIKKIIAGKAPDPQGRGFTIIR